MFLQRVLKGAKNASEGTVSRTHEGVNPRGLNHTMEKSCGNLHHHALSRAKHASMARRKSSWGIAGKAIGATGAHFPWSSDA